MVVSVRNVEYEDCTHCGGTGRDEDGDALGRCVYCDHEVACHAKLRGDDGRAVALDAR